MKKLPIGIQTFSTLISEGYCYVDKTPLIHRLVESGRYYFLSRPRRLIEFKVVELDGDGNALAQIKAKRYVEKYLSRGDTVYLIGVEFSRDQRNVVGFAWERAEDVSA